MASIETKSNGRRRIMKPDMTALVDVAFLMLMFFVMTAALMKPKGMELIAPRDGDKVNCGKVLTVYLGDNDKIYLLNPCESKPVETNWSPGGLRKALLDAEVAVKDLMVVCKPGKSCTYKNVVDALDEFHITELKKYTIGDLTEEEIELLKQNQIQIN